MNTTVLSGTLLALGGFFAGACVMGFVGLPLRYRHQRDRAEETVRLYEGVVLVRDDWPKPLTPRDTDTVADLPVQRPGWATEQARELPVVTPSRRPAGVARHRRSRGRFDWATFWAATATPRDPQARITAAMQRAESVTGQVDSVQRWVRPPMRYVEITDADPVHELVGVA